MIRNLLLLCSIALLACSVYGKASIPFQPIHPGALHADLFTPLNKDTVQVDFFQVDKFGALVLDFSSLTSATPVQFDLIGGIRFDNNNFETSGNGPIGFLSEVNDLNIEALQGNAQFQGNFINVNTRGDINYESTRGSIVARTEQDLNVQASAIRINGNYDGEGVFINSNGTTNLEAGVNGTSGGMYFEGKDLYLAADGTVLLQGNGSSSIRALDKIVIDSDASFSVFSQGNLDLLSNSGPAELDAGGAFTVQSTSYVSSSIGSQHLTSVLGSASYRSDATQTITTDDQVKFVSIGDITFQANGDVAVNAGTAIDLQSSPTIVEGVLSRALINASDVNIASARSHVSFHSSETLVVYSSSTTVRADNNGHITAQGSLTLAASLDLNIDAAQRSSISAGNNLAVNAPVGKITFDSVDDITLITSDLTEFQASDLVINANNDASFQIATDVNLTANGQFSKQWNGKGVFGARALYSANSNGNLVLTASNPASFNGQDGIEFVSGKDSTYTSNSGGLSLDAADFATYNVSGALRFLPNDISQASFSLETEALESLSLGASSFDSADSTTLNSAFDIVLTGDSYVSTSSQNTRYIIDNEIQFEAVTMAGFGGLGTASLDINSNTYFRYEVGDLLAQGDGDLTLTAEQAIYFYVRDADSFVANGQVEFTVDNQIGFDSQTVTVTTVGDLNVSADDLDLLANQVYYGDIVFRSGLGAIALNVGNSVSLDSDRFNVQAGSLAQFVSTGGNIVIQQVDEERSSNFGNILFGTNGTFTVTTTTSDINDLGLAITARTTEFAGKQGVSFNAQDSVQWTSTSSFTPNRVTADDTITLTALSTFQVQQPVIGVRANDTFQSVSVTGATTITATDDFASQFSGNATIRAANVATVTSEYTIATDDVTRIEAATGITFNSANAGMIEIGARGGGATFNTSTGDITLTTSGAGGVTQIRSDYEKVYFTALGSVANVSSTGTVLSMGGEHRFSSVTTTTLNANDGAFSSGNNGLTSVHSDRSIVQNVIEAVSILGSQDNGEPAGRYGDIRTTSENGNLCIRTNSALTGGKSTFDGSSVRFAATGDDSQLLVDAQGPLAMTSAAAIDLSAFGFRQGDPEFLLSNLQYGILVRSNTGPIALSSSGSLQVVTDEAQVYRSANGGVSSTQTQDTDIRTTGFNATIIAVSNAASIAQISNANGVYTAGNSLRPADFTANATRDILATAGQDIAWNQLGVATLPGQPGIEQLTFGSVSITSDGSFSATAADGGRINVQTEQGNAFVTATNNIQYTSVNGQTLFTGRGSATFDASVITLNAQGDGGNVRLESGSDQPLTFLANNGALTFTAQSGALQVLSEDAMILQIAQDFTINGDCLTVEGGSVTFDNDEAMTLTAVTDDIYFRSNLEFTVDTTELTFTAVEGQFILNAGGQNNAAGLAITVPVGDIDLVSEADTFLTTVKTSVTTSDVSTFTTESGGSLTFESRLDSNTQDSILLYSQTARVLVTSVDGGIFNSAQVSNQITSASLEVQTTDLTDTGKVVFSGDRLFELTIAADYSFELTGDFEITSNNVVLDIGGAFTATSTTDDIIVAADSRLDITTGATALVATESIIVSFVGRNAVGDWTTTGNVLVDSPTADITFDDLNIFSVDALTLAITTLGDSIDFEAANYTLNTGSDYSLTVTAGDFEEDAVGMLLTAETLTSSANAYTALTERVLFNAEDNINWLASAGPIAFASAFTHEFEFWANNDLNIQVAGDSAVTSTGGITIRGTGQAFTQESGSVNTGIYTDNSASSTFVSKRDITFAGFTGYSFTANNDITLTAQGPGGVQLVATAGITATATTSATLTANNGNVFLQGEGEFVLTTPLLTAQTSAEEFGNIYIQTDANSAVTAATLVFTDIPGNARAHDGFIEFNSLQTLELKVTTLLSLNANDDVRFTSPVSSTLSFTTLDASSSSLVLHDASQTVAVIATGPITLTVGTTPLPPPSSLSDIQFKSNNVFLTTNTGDQTYTAGDTIEINGPAALFNARAAFTVNTPEEAFVTAERADITVNSPSNTYTANNNIYIEALGTDGPVNIVSGGVISFIAADTIRVEAQGRIWAPYSTINASQRLRLVSSSDAFFDGSTLNFNANAGDISFQTAYDGSFEIKSRGFVTYQADSDLNIRADGMLDNVNGRYVLSDAYYLEFGRFQQTGFLLQNGGLLQTQDIRISRNTNGLEFNAVTGNVLTTSTDTEITAAQGSISSRGQNAVRYIVPNNGFMRFFGIDPLQGTVDGITTGTLRTIPFALSTDYCFDAGPQCNLGACRITCSTLSIAINDILEALVAYGLVQCTGGSGFCF